MDTGHDMSSGYRKNNPGYKKWCLRGRLECYNENKRLRELLAQARDTLACTSSGPVRDLCNQIERALDENA